MTHVTRRLTAKNRDQLRNPTLGNRVRAAFTFLSVKLWVIADGEIVLVCHFYRCSSAAVRGC